MIDMNKYTVTRSNRLNSEDLVGTSRTISVTQVRETGKEDIPITIHYEGDNGKPFEPCLTVRKILKAAWGEDAEQYGGKSMTLYCDPDVTFGSDTVGGVRVSHLSHIDKPIKISLMVRRGKKKLFTIQPLQVQQKAEPTPEEKHAAAQRAAQSIIDEINGGADYDATLEKHAKIIDKLRAGYADLYASIEELRPAAQDIDVMVEEL